MPKRMRRERSLGMRKIIIILGVILVFGGCVSSPPPPVAYVANFIYSPPSQEAVQQHPVVFTVGKAYYKYAGKKNWLATPQFANFEKAIADDLPEILTAKGFSVRGPFDTYDLIPFQDKKAIDFHLLPVVTPVISVHPFIGVKVFQNGVHVGLPKELWNVPIEVTVTMNLELREIITREVMWHKSLAVTEFEVPIRSVLESYTYENGIITRLNFKPQAFENVMAKEMEKQYPVVMDTIYKLIDPEEMTIIRKQAQEVKSEKGY